MTAEPSIARGAVMPETHSASPCLLVVEDYLPLQESLVRLLQRTLAADVLSASRTDEGLRLARLHRPDVILTDYLHEGGTGLDLVKAVRETATLKYTPIIVLSGGVYTDPAAVRQLEVLGVAEILTKPVSAETLVEAVSVQLNVRRRFQAPERDDALVHFGSELDSLTQRPQWRLELVFGSGGEILGGSIWDSRAELWPTRRVEFRVRGGLGSTPRVDPRCRSGSQIASLEITNLNAARETRLR